MRLVSWAATDTGKKRDHNEDSFLVDEKLNLYAVADGMGGHQGGGHASKLACDVLWREITETGGDYAAAAARLLGAPKERSVGRSTEELIALAEGPTMDGIGEDDTLDGTELTPRSASEAVRAGRGFAVPETRPVEPLDANNLAEDDETVPGGPAVPSAAIIMARAARTAGHEIYDAAQETAELQGMGTTLSAIIFDDGHLHFVHAGDSRVYMFRDGKLRQLSEDHSWIWEQIKSGAMSEAEAKASKFRHIITRSVGFEREIEVDTGGVAVQAGDCFLLCSDGMSNYVENDELERILTTTWYRRAPRLLIDIANDRGGDDNITVVLVYAANDDS
jgi:protein phosphatase